MVHHVRRRAAAAGPVGHLFVLHAQGVQHLAGGVVELFARVAQRAAGVVGQGHAAAPWSRRRRPRSPAPWVCPSVAAPPQTEQGSARGAVRRLGGRARRGLVHGQAGPRGDFGLRALLGELHGLLVDAAHLSGALGAARYERHLAAGHHRDHQAHVAQGHLGVQGAHVEAGHVVELGQPAEQGDGVHEGLVEHPHVLGHLALLGDHYGLQVFENARYVDVARATAGASEALYAELDGFRIQDFIDHAHLQHAHELVGHVVKGEGGRATGRTVAALIALAHVRLCSLDQLLPIERCLSGIVSDQTDPPRPTVCYSPHGARATSGLLQKEGAAGAKHRKTSIAPGRSDSDGLGPILHLGKPSEIGILCP